MKHLVREFFYVTELVFFNISHFHVGLVCQLVDSLLQFLCSCFFHVLFSACSGG